MASITLKSIPTEWHRQVKLIQFDLEDKNKKMTLEEIYLMLIEKGMNQYKKENPV